MGKVPYSKRFEDAVGQACESAAARRVAHQFGLAESTVRAIDLRYLERWSAGRRKAALKPMGVDEIYPGKMTKFLTVVSKLELGEPIWFGQGRLKETLDECFATQLRQAQRIRIEAACVDMWAPFKSSIQQWTPNCAIVYYKIHVMQHANTAVDEVRRAEFYRKGGWRRKVVKGKRWWLLTRWVNLSGQKKQLLNQLFALNRRLMKAYPLKESLDRLWLQPSEDKAREYRRGWIRQIRRQRLTVLQKQACLLLDHLEGLLSCYRVKVRLGVVEAISGNIRTVLKRGRSNQNRRYLLLKVQRMAATRTEFVAFRKAA